MANFSFNANEVAPDEGRADAIPAAWYRLMLVSSEIKPTNAGTGKYINCMFEVVDGQYKNAKIFAMFNIDNPNPQAVEIGRKQFSALCHACGILTVQATEQLHNIPFLAKVKVKAAEGGYDAKNEIAQYKHQSDPSAGQPGAAVAPAAVRVAPPAPKAPAFTPPPVMQQAAPVQAWTPPPGPIVAPMSPEETKWRAEQAAAAAAAQPAAWTPPAAAQPWANQPVNVVQVDASVAPVVAAASAPVATPPWMVQPTA
jgi:hypothetical protein